MSRFTRLACLVVLILGVWAGVAQAQVTADMNQSGPFQIIGIKNNMTFIRMTRQTDTAPTGSFLSFLNAAGTSVFNVDVSGNLTVASLVGPTILTGTTTLTAVTVGVPTGSQVLGNDLVIGVSGSAIAPAGPGVGAATIRMRQSPKVPGSCRAMLAVGPGFQEFPIMVQVGPTGVVPPTVDIPGGC